jgi:hypothetical protein
MKNELTYNPVKALTPLDHFADYCRDRWGVNAPEVVTTMIAAFLLPVILGGVVLAQL